MNEYFIGISCSMHDSAVAILDEKGQILFAEATERVLQNKRALNIAPLNVVYASHLLKSYCSEPAIFNLAYTWSKPFLRKLQSRSFSGFFKLQDKILKYYTKGVKPHLFPDLTSRWAQVSSFNSISSAGIGFKMAVSMNSPDSIIREKYHNHHSTHAALACYGSPFDEGICVVVDGNGDKGSLSIYQYGEGKLKKVYQNKGLASLGVFYNILTQACGFSHFKGEQWKVMGLAPYGSKSERIYKIMESMISVDGYQLRFPKPKVWRAALQELSRYCITPDQPKELATDLAYTGQLFYSDLMNKLLKSVFDNFKTKKLILTGGCALNSSYNGTILDSTPFEDLYIPSAPADDGNALGGALLSFYQQVDQQSSIHKNCSPYLGTPIRQQSLNKLSQFSRIPFKKLEDQALFEKAAQLLAEGKIIGWVQGHAEYGPRALGNRSILADPRDPQMKEKINAKVKFREGFRPFAPSILHDFGPEYFEHYQDSPYMERALKFKKEVINKIPAVVHINGTGRLQSVKKNRNKKYYLLIKAFFDRTGVPVILNTSFNIKGKPIIATIEDAIGMFYSSGLDALVIHNFLIEK